MKYTGREIDPLKLWEEYVEFPPNLKLDGKFLPLVFCPNPNHDNARSPAFQINIEDGLVHCFAECGISGTFTKAISLIEGINERQARRLILRRAGTNRRTSRRVLQAAGRNFKKQDGLGQRPVGDSLDYQRRIPQFGIDYLDRRGITPGSISRWEIGWDAEDKRIVIPGKDLHGHTRLLIRRAVRPNDWPKYLYSEGFPKTSLLFGACEIDPGLLRSFGIVLVEGSFDAIVLQQFGFPACAVLGTGISEIQSRIVANLRPKVVFLAFDRDTSGIRGIEIAARRLRKEPLRVVRYPKGKYDPAEMTEEEAHRQIARAVPVSKVIARSERN
jgi:DNA primase